MRPEIVDERTKSEIIDQPRSLRETILKDAPRIDRAAKAIVDRGCKRIFLTGMGSSYSAALIAKVFANSTLTIPVDVYRGYELEFEAPVGLGHESCVVPISFSGETEDVVSALRFARKRGAYIISISGPEDSTLVREADQALQITSEDTKAMVAAHLSQVAVLYLLIGSIAKYRDNSNRIFDMTKELNVISAKLPEIIERERDRARKVAESVKDQELFYVISAGPSFGVAYKLAMTELTENAWAHGIAQYAGEFRHGIIEKIEKGLPVIFLIGTDPSQVDLRRELGTCQKLGAHTIVWDAKDFPKTDPFLVPFYLEIPTEWFVYHLSLLRGKAPSSRRYMGSVIPYANMKKLKQ
jgi:glucosamine--fructose-6-phosphate aminotransferase (isomerizing)